MATKKTTKQLIETGFYFQFEPKNKYYATGEKYKYTPPKTKSYHGVLHRFLGSHILDSVLVRRIGEKNLDYFTYDMFSKKTRGRIQFKDLTNFSTTLAEATKPNPVIEKSPAEGLDAIGVGPLSKY